MGTIALFIRLLTVDLGETPTWWRAGTERHGHARGGPGHLGADGRSRAQPHGRGGVHRRRRADPPVRAAELRLRDLALRRDVLRGPGRGVHEPASRRPAPARDRLAWRGGQPFHTTAERAAKPLLPDLPDRSQELAGQFAFGNPDRVRGILADAGWKDVELQPLDVECTLPADALGRASPGSGRWGWRSRRPTTRPAPR